MLKITRACGVSAPVVQPLTEFVVLRGGLGTERTGHQGLSETFKHHHTIKTLKESAAGVGCSICKALAIELEERGRELNVPDNGKIAIQAELTKLEDIFNLAFREHSTEKPIIYKLDFTMETVQLDLNQNAKKKKVLLRTFALKPTNGRSIEGLRTPKSSSTSSNEVLELSRSWVRRCQETCKCASSWQFAEQPIQDMQEMEKNLNERHWYPKRLLDLTGVRNAKGIRKVGDILMFSENKDLNNQHIKLVDREELPKSRDRTYYQYVTLSHCWGAPNLGVLKLTSQNETILKKQGIKLKRLPQTFQDAIKFACNLEKIGYIWIDSLCIKQKSSGSTAGAKDPEDDWLEQSREMGRVYADSFLNISATASSSSDEGLYRYRDPEFLWEDEIYLNVSGLDRQGPKERSKLGPNLDPLMRCTIIDVSFWEDLVERAPVNQRGWVLQERILCPRVLHFCKDQIAWECKGFQCAEGYPEDLPTWRRKLSQIVDEGLFKGLQVKDGQRLREVRRGLKGQADSDGQLDEIYVLELWKRIVEVYSRTNLSFSTDKLIALSGIARHFSQMLELCQYRYIAGMWEKPNHLESQLLWQVDISNSGVFENHSKRFSQRAPSFSWASLDTPGGINYGHVTDYGQKRHESLFFEVTECEVTPADDQNEFGMLRDGQGRLKLKARYLRRIEVYTDDDLFKHPFGYRWRFHKSEEPPLPHLSAANVPMVIFDTPESDIDIGIDGELYCMPAATVEKDLFCLLLKLESEPKSDFQTFRRFGVTKLKDFRHQGYKAILLKQLSERSIYLC